MPAESLHFFWKQKFGLEADEMAQAQCGGGRLSFNVQKAAIDKRWEGVRSLDYCKEDGVVRSVIEYLGIIVSGLTNYSGEITRGRGQVAARGCGGTWEDDRRGQDGPVWRHRNGRLR